jgi:hypothetical protein
MISKSLGWWNTEEFGVIQKLDLAGGNVKSPTLGDFGEVGYQIVRGMI